VLDLSLVLVVVAKTTLSVFGPILPSFRNFFCVIMADIVCSDDYFVGIRAFHLRYNIHLF